MASREFAEIEIIARDREAEGRRRRHHRREELLRRDAGGRRRSRAPVPEARAADRLVLRARLRPEPDRALGREAEARNMVAGVKIVRKELKSDVAWAEAISSEIPTGRRADSPCHDRDERTVSARRRLPRRRPIDRANARRRCASGGSDRAASSCSGDGRHLLFDPYLSDSLPRKYASTDKPHVRMTRTRHRAGEAATSSTSSPRATTTPIISTPRRLCRSIEANPWLQLVAPRGQRSIRRRTLRARPAVRHLGAADAGRIVQTAPYEFARRPRGAPQYDRVRRAWPLQVSSATSSRMGAIDDLSQWRHAPLRRHGRRPSASSTSTSRSSRSTANSRAAVAGIWTASRPRSSPRTSAPSS